MFETLLTLQKSHLPTFYHACQLKMLVFSGEEGHELKISNWQIGE